LPAYCLMNHHYHLLMETPDGNLSRGMRQLNGLYTQRFNKRHQQVGPLLSYLCDQPSIKPVFREGRMYCIGGKCKIKSVRWVDLLSIHVKMNKSPALVMS